MKTFIIAEAGSCHDGSLRRAIELVHIAKNAGADAVKFQFWSDAEQLAERRHAYDYLETYRRYQLPSEWLPALKWEADRDAIEFICTVYLPQDVQVLRPFVSRWKVSSFESHDRALLRAIVDSQHMNLPVLTKRVIVSIGMADRNEPVENVGADLDILHCVSAYPAPVEQLNLAVVRHPLIAGFSDHSRNILTGAVAVGVGAKILEVHVRHWATNEENPDYDVGFHERELKLYIDNVRQAEQMIGDGVKRRMPCEEPMAKYRVTA